jgi:hypothetical protein
MERLQAHVLEQAALAHRRPRRDAIDGCHVLDGAAVVGEAGRVVVVVELLEEGDLFAFTLTLTFTLTFTFTFTSTSTFAGVDGTCRRRRRQRETETEGLEEARHPLSPGQRAKVSGKAGRGSATSTHVSGRVLSGRQPSSTTPSSSRTTQSAG